MKPQVNLFIPPLLMNTKLTADLETTATSQNYCVVNFEGNYDKFGLEQVKENIEKLVDTCENKYLVFNFAKLNFINSESIGFLLTLHSRLVKKDKSLVLLQAPNNVKDVLEVIGMFKIISHYDSLAQFEQTLK